jgi:hypothetical protein
VKSYVDIVPFIIHVYNGLENMRAVIVPSNLSSGEDGYGVILFDMDVELAVGGIRVYKNLDFAKEYAKESVNPFGK